MAASLLLLHGGIVITLSQSEHPFGCSFLRQKRELA